MKYRLLPIICAAVMGLCAHAHAARIYYLVGLRHVYSVPALPDPHELDRQAIEEDYSKAVADAQKQYDTDMASIHDEEAKDGGNIHQIDRDAVQQNLEAAVADAADRREADLVQYYPQVDYVRTSHPEFKVDQDGPYRVIGVDTAPTGEYVNVVYYRPYPTYVWLCPFGWAWGQPYSYATFGVQVGLFHSTWISIGAPVFEPIYYGGAVVVVNAPIRQNVIISRAGWAGGRPPVITAQDRASFAQHQALLQKSNYAAQASSRLAPEYAKSVAAGSHYSRPSGVSTSKYARANRTTSTGSGAPSSTSTNANRYSRTTSSVTGSGSSAAPSTATSKYNRIGTSGSTRSGSYSRSTTTGSGSSHSGSSSSKGN